MARPGVSGPPGCHALGKARLAINALAVILIAITIAASIANVWLGGGAEGRCG